MTSEELYDLAIQRGWEDLYDLAPYFSAEEWEMVFDIYTTGFMHGALDILNARITRENI